MRRSILLAGLLASAAGAQGQELAQLLNATSANSTDAVPATQNGVTRKLTVGQINAAPMAAVANIASYLHLVTSWTSDPAGLLAGTVDVGTAITLAAATGQAVLPCGSYTLGAGIGLSAALTAATPGCTSINYTPASGVALTLTADRARVSGVALGTTAAGSTASAVQMGGPGTNPVGQAIEDVAITGFGTQIDVQSGQWWHIARFDLHNPNRYAVRVRNLYNADSGDGIIDGGVIRADTSLCGTGCVTAVRYESGGGLKMRSTKVLQFQHAFDLEVADGAITSDLDIDGSNSFENQTGTAVMLGQLGPAKTGTFAHVRVSPQVSNGQLTIGAGITDALLGGIYNQVGTAITINGGDGIRVSPDLIVRNASVAGVAVNDPAINVSVPSFRCTGCAAQVVDGRTSGAGPVERQDTRPISLAQSSSYTPLYEVDVPASRGARISVQVEGTLAGAGSVNTQSVNTLLDVLVANSGSGIAIPATVSNVQAGQAAVDIQFDTTTVADAVRVGVRPNAAAGGGTLNGSVSVRVDGKSTYFKAL